ncbi:unnamed protein product [Wuchereria bancrofti]|uniref:BHLH domain-containing protein n=1 Tax=Wuchereria bancrofti TaxID=6293 RepID=A0A3P7FFR9_WUCBA|nr:unnamed protein product [Wuchereria bancrofti]
MTTPKWKDFKGLRLHWKQRIRLNNVIWRAYYMEFRRPDKDKSRRTPYCYFTVPDDDSTHVKFTGTVVEGMYWKRSMDALKAQYKRWRHSRTRRRGRRRGISWNQEISSVPQLAVQNSMIKNSSAEQPDTDDLDNEFTDTLFANLMQPYTFPDPKEITQGCNADVMQPGLLSLQPSIEEIMASLDPPDQLLDEIGNYGASNVSPTSPCTPKEYEATFSNNFTNPTQQQPTRQSSSISPQILLANSSAPTYSQAAYEHTPLIATMPYTTDSSNLDYVPQFLTTTMQFPSSVLPNRTWWMNFPSTPTPSLLNGPSTPSVVLSPSSSSTTGVLSLPVNSPTTISTVETHLINTSSKNSIKIFPTPTDTLKLQTERWNVTGLCSLPREITTDSTEHEAWKAKFTYFFLYNFQQLPSTANTANQNSLPVPQPVYPQENSQLMPKVTASSSHEQSTLLPASTTSIKQEHEKEERIHRVQKRGCRSVAADSTIEPVERKRILHLNAEQNRRCALKDGFEQLLNSLPNLYGCGTKPTNAVVLTRAAERIRQLKAEIALDEEKTKQLKQNIQRLNDKIVSLQASLPSSSRTTVSTISQKAEMEQFLERYTKERTRQDYRFWVMAKMMQPLTDTLIERLSQLPSNRALAETSDWLQTNFQLSTVRANASSLLVYLATHAGMLNDPNALQECIQRELSQ